MLRPLFTSASLNKSINAWCCCLTTDMCYDNIILCTAIGYQPCYIIRSTKQNVRAAFFFSKASLPSPHDLSKLVIHLSDEKKPPSIPILKILVMIALLFPTWADTLLVESMKSLGQLLLVRRLSKLSYVKSISHCNKTLLPPISFFPLLLLLPFCDK